MYLDPNNLYKGFNDLSIPNKRLNLQRAIKDMKLWRAVIDHILKVDSTEKKNVT